MRRVIESSAPQGDDAVMAKLQDLSELWANGAMLEVADGIGRWLFRSEPFLHENPVVQRTFDTNLTFVTTNLNFNQYRVATARVQAAGKNFEIHAAVPTEPFDQALDRFRITEEEILPVLVLLASMLGYWLSGRSLAPINRIIHSAEQIGVNNLSQRLEVPAPRDELRRLTETLNAMLGRIEASFRRITQFTADASHDLRTPVAVMRTTAEIALRKQRPMQKYRQALSRILDTSVKTSQMLENLLTLARADAGAAGLEMHRLDLGVHVRKAQEQAAVLAADKSLRLTLRLPNAPVWVRADAIAIHRLLLILLDNAVKFTPVGGQCEIALARTANLACIEVTDNGIGISEGELGSIFERFTRADRARSADVPGAGLGLAIARWITDMHGGSIAAESKPGAGSTFHVRLPAIAN